MSIFLYLLVSLFLILVILMKFIGVLPPLYDNTRSSFILKSDWLTVWNKICCTLSLLYYKKCLFYENYYIKNYSRTRAMSVWHAASTKKLMYKKHWQKVQTTKILSLKILRKVFPEILMYSFFSEEPIQANFLLRIYLGNHYYNFNSDNIPKIRQFIPNSLTYKR